MSKYLQDPEYLFGILTVLVKKNGGKIILDAQDMLRAQSIVNDKVDETYDN